MTDHEEVLNSTENDFILDIQDTDQLNKDQLYFAYVSSYSIDVFWGDSAGEAEIIYHGDDGAIATIDRIIERSFRDVPGILKNTEEGWTFKYTENYFSDYFKFLCVGDPEEFDRKGIEADKIIKSEGLPLAKSFLEKINVRVI